MSIDSAPGIVIYNREECEVAKIYSNLIAFLDDFC